MVFDEHYTREEGGLAMKGVVAAVAAVTAGVFVQVSVAFAEDACPDPWAKLQGSYKCEGACNYTAAVCDLPFYATGSKRWRFAGGRSASATGVLEGAGRTTIAFATTPAWNFTAANTADCGATIKFDGTPKDVTWRRLDDNPRACGGRSSRQKR